MDSISNGMDSIHNIIHRHIIHSHLYYCSGEESLLLFLLFVQLQPWSTFDREEIQEEKIVT